MVTTPVTVLMPVYNENHDNLKALIQDVLVAGYALILVDDGSDDGIQAGFPDVIILRHQVNLGQGAALETGMQYARYKGIEMLVHMDADGQHRVDEIATLLQPILTGKADIVFGSRFLSSKSVSLIPWRRRWQLRISKYINTFFTGVRMSDVHNGFRAMNQKAIQQIRLKVSGRGHASEIVYQANIHKLKFCEAPVHIDYDQPNQTNPMSLGKMLSLGGSLFWARLNKYKMKIPEKVSYTRQQCLRAAGINN